MSKRAASIALACALLGLVASSAAAYTHYHILYDPSYRSFCDVNETISCTQVYQSRYRTVAAFRSRFLASLWFVVAGLLSVLAARPRRGSRKHSGLSFRAVDGRALVDPVPGLCLVLYC